MIQNPGVYFRNLSELMLQAQVTEQRGTDLSLEEGLSKAIEWILSKDRKIMVVGNGGSAAIASHVQNDLCKAVGVRALVFNEQPLLTALSNDHGYGCVFEKPVELWAESGDLLIAISSSGQSENILRAVQAAKSKNCRIITFSGFNPENSLRQAGDLNFYIASRVYGEVEVSHMALAHFITDSAMAAQSKTKKLASKI